MPKHYIWLLIITTALLWLASLLVVRYWTRKKILAGFDPVTLEGEDICLPFNDPRPEDKAAMDVVRACRRRYLLKMWPDTEFSLKIIMNLALELIQQIAAVYHPEDERPELHASLSELISLQTRISVRLQALLETLPLRAVKDVELETILYYHQVYKQFTGHPTYLFLKRHHLDKIARWSWMVKNIASPWYWGYRAAYYGGKEMLARYFLARMATIVGVEAIRLYSGRAPGVEQWRKYDLVMQEILYVTAINCVPEAEAWRFLTHLILKNRELPEQAKLLLLERLPKMAADTPAQFHSLTSAERGQVRRWLKQYMVKVLPAEAHKLRWQELIERLAEPRESSG
jgi:hypothetical protein